MIAAAPVEGFLATCDEPLIDAYRAMFDERTRSAHLALHLHARAVSDDGWPTPAMAVEFARVHGVRAAELGAFFGLISFRHGTGTAWVDAMRGDVPSVVARMMMSREAALAFGMMLKMLDGHRPATH